MRASLLSSLWLFAHCLWEGGRKCCSAVEAGGWRCYLCSMTLHILKLCVGCDSIEELALWQRQRLATLRQVNPKAELMHVTRQTPRRDGFTPGSSSIYWVIGGFARVRQRIAGLKEVRGADGILRCGLVLDPNLVTTAAYPRRAFQGWRYLAAEEAPADSNAATPEAVGSIPSAMHAALTELRLL
jgi:hypothetical protein